MTQVVEDQHNRNFKAVEIRRQNSGKKQKGGKKVISEMENKLEATPETLSQEKPKVKRTISRMKTD